MSLLISGAQQTLTLAILAVAARLLVGFVLGAIAGWTNGSLLDRAIMGLAEIISAFPTLLIAMILILALGIREGMSSFVIALCLIGWGEIMQFVRGEVISLRPQPFIESAIATGARTLRILTRHVMPNLLAALVSIAALEMGAVLMLLGELGFISIFIGGGSLIALPSMTILYSDVPEWGALLSNIRYLVRSYPWVGLYPMLAFFVAIFSFNLLGEGVRRMVDEGNPLLNKLVNRYTVLVVFVAVLGYNWLNANSGAMPYFRDQARQFSGEQALAHLQVLTDPRLEGRALGSQGMNYSAMYVALKFEEYGLQPGGASHSYYQERKRSFERLLDEPEMTILGSEPLLVNGVDFAPYPGRNMTSGSARGPIRFIGLGGRASPTTGGWVLHYPELDRADYTGEILLALSDRDASIVTGGVPKDGMLVVTQDPALLQKRFTLSGRSGKYRDWFTGEIEGKEIPYLWITEETADRLLSGSGYSLDQLRDEVDVLPLEEVYDLPLGTEVAMSLEGIVEEKVPVQNVIGLWPGSVSFDYCYDCPANKLIVVIAQYDSPPIGPDGVYEAANDNASGVAVLLEALRTMQETEYQPYKSFLFVAYSGEGLDGGERVIEGDVSKILQANPSFSNFTLDSIILLRGLGDGTGDRLEISAGGSLRLAELFEMAARRMGVGTVRSSETIDISLIYDQTPSTGGGQDAPMVRLYWEGWEATSRLPTDALVNVSPDNLEDAGRALSLALMVMGRENE
jgi:ABC-type dipeptide/oligopeptide/nickel transport system permease subunit